MISPRGGARKVPIVVGEGFEKSIEFDAPITEAPTDAGRFEKTLFAVVAERVLGSGGPIDIKAKIADRLMLG